MHAVPGQVDFRLWIGLHAQVARIRDNSDDRDLGRLRAQDAEQDICSDGVSSGEITLRKRLVDDEETIRIADILLLEETPLLQAESHGAKEGGTDEANLSHRRRS